MFLVFSESPKGKPVISYKNTDVETKNYTASCSMNQNTNETIWYRWRKNGEDIGEETKSGILFIHSIQRTNAGTYICRGRNVAGHSDSDPISIIVHCMSVYCDEM